MFHVPTKRETRSVRMGRRAGFRRSLAAGALASDEAQPPRVGRPSGAETRGPSGGRSRGGSSRDEPAAVPSRGGVRAPGGGVSSPIESSAECSRLHSVRSETDEGRPPPPRLAEETAAICASKVESSGVKTPIGVKRPVAPLLWPTRIVGGSSACTRARGEAAKGG